MSEIAGLKKNVGFLNWAIGTTFVLGLAAIAGSYLALDGEVEEINKTVAGQTATLDAIKGSLERIEDRIDGNQSQASAGSGQSGAVPEGTSQGFTGGR